MTLNAQSKKDLKLYIEKAKNDSIFLVKKLDKCKLLNQNLNLSLDSVIKSNTNLDATINTNKVEIEKLNYLVQNLQKQNAVLKDSVQILLATQPKYIEDLFQLKTINGLQVKFGSENLNIQLVTDGPEGEILEGDERYYSMSLFPNSPNELNIFANIEKTLTIIELGYTANHQTIWKSRSNVAVGMNLSDLESINGGNFVFSNPIDIMEFYGATNFKKGNLDNPNLSIILACNNSDCFDRMDEFRTTDKDSYYEYNSTNYYDTVDCKIKVESITVIAP